MGDVPEDESKTISDRMAGTSLILMVVTTITLVTVFLSDSDNLEKATKELESVAIATSNWKSYPINEMMSSKTFGYWNSAVFEHNKYTDGTSVGFGPSETCLYLRGERPRNIDGKSIIEDLGIFPFMITGGQYYIEYVKNEKIPPYDSSDITGKIYQSHEGYVREPASIEEFFDTWDLLRQYQIADIIVPPEDSGPLLGIICTELTGISKTKYCGAFLLDPSDSHNVPDKVIEIFPKRMVLTARKIEKYERDLIVLAQHDIYGEKANNFPMNYSYLQYQYCLTQHRGSSLKYLNNEVYKGEDRYFFIPVRSVSVSIQPQQYLLNRMNPEKELLKSFPFFKELRQYSDEMNKKEFKLKPEQGLYYLRNIKEHITGEVEIPGFKVPSDKIKMVAAILIPALLFYLIIHQIEAIISNSFGSLGNSSWFGFHRNEISIIIYIAVCNILPTYLSIYCINSILSENFTPCLLWTIVIAEISCFTAFLEILILKRINSKRLTEHNIFKPRSHT